MRSVCSDARVHRRTTRTFDHNDLDRWELDTCLDNAVIACCRSRRHRGIDIRVCVIATLGSRNALTWRRYAGRVMGVTLGMTIDQPGRSDGVLVRHAMRHRSKRQSKGSWKREGNGQLALREESGHDANVP